MNRWTVSGSALKPGDYHFVVMEDRSVRAFHSDTYHDAAIWVGHTSLSRRKPVIMAGIFDVNNAGEITEFSNFSGHLRPLWNPHNNALEEIARDAFARHNFPAERAEFVPYKRQIRLSSSS